MHAESTRGQPLASSLVARGPPPNRMQQNCNALPAKTTSTRSLQPLSAHLTAAVGRCRHDADLSARYSAFGEHGLFPARPLNSHDTMPWRKHDFDDARRLCMAGAQLHCINGGVLLRLYRCQPPMPTSANGCMHLTPVAAAAPQFGLDESHFRSCLCSVSERFAFHAIRVVFQSPPQAIKNHVEVVRTP